MTPALQQKLQREAKEDAGFDPVVCAQNEPALIRYSQPTVTGAHAVVVVSTHYASSDNPVTVTIDLNTLKLTDLTCPQHP